MKSLLLQFVREESGASSIEYALIAVAIAAVVVVTVNSLGTKVNDEYEMVSAALAQE
jgi:pilus assembly protein Flp/PilA